MVGLQFTGGGMPVLRDRRDDDANLVWSDSAGVGLARGRMLMVSAGDAAVNLQGQRGVDTVLYDAEISADRVVALPTGDLFSGLRFRVVRSANASGAFNVNVDDGPVTIKALGTAGTWCDVLYTGSGWVCAAAGED